MLFQLRYSGQNLWWSTERFLINLVSLNLRAEERKELSTNLLGTYPERWIKFGVDLNYILRKNALAKQYFQLHLRIFIKSIKSISFKIFNESNDKIKYFKSFTILVWQIELIFWQFWNSHWFLLTNWVYFSLLYVRINFWHFVLDPWIVVSYGKFLFFELDFLNVSSRWEKFNS